VVIVIAGTTVNCNVFEQIMSLSRFRPDW
jgi:hypothetical protein